MGQSLIPSSSRQSVTPWSQRPFGVASGSGDLPRALGAELRPEKLPWTMQAARSLNGNWASTWATAGLSRLQSRMPSLPLCGRRGRAPVSGRAKGRRRRKDPTPVRMSHGTLPSRHTELPTQGGKIVSRGAAAMLIMRATSATDCVKSTYTRKWTSSCVSLGSARSDLWALQLSIRRTATARSTFNGSSQLRG